MTRDQQAGNLVKHHLHLGLLPRRLLQGPPMLSRHSSSFFLSEMNRMMPSFNPGGADSVSVSAEKPYLYSLSLFCRWRLMTRAP